MIIDSNIIIYSARPEYVALTNYLRVHQEQVYVSLISALEVLGFNRLLPSEKPLLEAYFQAVTVLPIDKSVIEEAIRLRQQRKRSLADAIIAATGLLYRLPLLTNNVADFTNITGLQVISLEEVLNSSTA